MPEEEKKEQIISEVSEEKKALENQLDAFTNPNKVKNNTIDASAYYSKPDTNQGTTVNKNEPTIFAESKVINKPIVRTYKSDVEEKIQTGHISSINIAIAQSKKLHEQSALDEINPKNNSRNKIIIIVSILLIIGGALTFFIPKLLIQLQYGPKTAAVETVPSKPIMTVDTEEKVNISTINLTRVSTTLKERVDQSSTKLGEIKDIFLTEGAGVNENLITSKKFLDLIQANVSPEIARTLKDPYMFGMYNYNGNQRFVILKVGSFDTTFSGMLHWEPNLWQDFKELFNLSSSDTAPADPFIIEVKKFQDATFDNKDARVIKDANGNIIFLYSIIDDSTIVITTSTDTLREIINRISKAKVITQ